MIAFFDTEYSKDMLAAIGIVRGDGEELFLVNGDFNHRASADTWRFHKHIWKRYLRNERKEPLARIKSRVRRFLDPVELLVSRGGEDDAMIHRLLDRRITIFDLEKHWNQLGQPRLRATNSQASSAGGRLVAPNPLLQLDGGMKMLGA